LGCALNGLLLHDISPREYGSRRLCSGPLPQLRSIDPLVQHPHYDSASVIQIRAGARMGYTSL
jgi:hypothetical protein